MPNRPVASASSASAGWAYMGLKFAAAYGCDVTAFTSSESKFDEAIAVSAPATSVSSRDSAAIERQLAGHNRRTLQGEILDASRGEFHVHVVIAADAHPDEVRKQLKAWSARMLKQLWGDRALKSPRQSTTVAAKWWTAGGSSRYLNDSGSLEAAIRDVREAQ